MKDANRRKSGIGEKADIHPSFCRVLPYIKAFDLCQTCGGPHDPQLTCLQNWLSALKANGASS